MSGRFRNWAFLSIALSVTLASNSVLGQNIASRLIGHTPVLQKGGSMQKGMVTQKGKGAGCHDCGAGIGGGCGSKCGACDSCCICLIPAVINGVGNLLDGIFRCGSCCDTGYASKSYSCNSCVGPRKGARSCGCQPIPLFSRRCNACGGKGGGKGGGTYYSPMTPTLSDPFIDDSLTPPPVPMTEARVLRRAPVRRPPAMVVSTSRARETPRAISVSSARPLSKPRQATKAPTGSRVIRANNVSDEEQFPVNPLRN